MSSKVVYRLRFVWHSLLSLPIQNARWLVCATRVLFHRCVSNDGASSIGDVYGLRDTCAVCGDDMGPSTLFGADISDCEVNSRLIALTDDTGVDRTFEVDDSGVAKEIVR